MIESKPSVVVRGGKMAMDSDDRVMQAFCEAVLRHPGRFVGPAESVPNCLQRYAPDLACIETLGEDETLCDVNAATLSNGAVLPVLTSSGIYAARPDGAPGPELVGASDISVAAANPALTGPAPVELELAPPPPMFEDVQSLQVHQIPHSTRSILDVKLFHARPTPIEPGLVVDRAVWRHRLCWMRTEHDELAMERTDAQCGAVFMLAARVLVYIASRLAPEAFNIKSIRRFFSSGVNGGADLYHRLVLVPAVHAVPLGPGAVLDAFCRGMQSLFVQFGSHRELVCLSELGDVGLVQRMVTDYVWHDRGRVIAKWYKILFVVDKAGKVKDENCQVETRVGTFTALKGILMVGGS